MKKSIAASVKVSVIICTAAFLFSACTLFQGNEGRNRTAFSQQPSIYHGKISTNSDESRDHYSMGCVFQEKGKHRLAVAEFEAAVQTDPDNAMAYNAKGISLDRMGEYSKAQTAYLAALAIHLDRSDVLNNLGYSYLLQARPELAVDYLTRAVALDQENERYRNNLGVAYARIGDHEAALQTFLAAGDKARAYSNMGRLYYREGDYDRAAQHFSMASALKPSDTDSGNGLIAATSLARIHEEKQEMLDNTEEKRQGLEEDDLTARYDADGFTTIPAGAIEDPEIIEIEPAYMAILNEKTEDRNDQPIYTVSLAEFGSAEGQNAAIRKTMEVERNGIIHESRAPELLGLDGTDIQRQPMRRVKIEVSNGNGLRHMARNVGTYLTGKGFILMYLSNADHFNHVGTSIYYTKENAEEAYRLSQELPGLQTLEEVQDIRNGNAGIRVRIGRDLTNHLSLFEMG
ncbi:hypothetical protein DSCW_23750 [Desulfosarcina widdelii]|uniref:LytR/CpsA/Psr regulator C-terminal domain-containing protein n=1 Tax=Desulfosarcina widdelii TaxID=947919 RepID=A0A5K7Z219_9BACT|nr:tetratricopeptide repeat protein [Desulfosarcina widdelii]BBO74958.1 hypothetical protein DSCW_23750 [Desulfosarcina widdelii]